MNRGRYAIRALKEALDYIATAKGGKKDDRAKADMTEAQDYVVLAIYRLSPRYLSPMDVTYLRAKGWIGPPVTYTEESIEVAEELARQRDLQDTN